MQKYFIVTFVVLFTSCGILNIQSDKPLRIVKTQIENCNNYDQILSESDSGKYKSVCLFYLKTGGKIQFYDKKKIELNNDTIMLNYLDCKSKILISDIDSLKKIPLFNREKRDVSLSLIFSVPGFFLGGITGLNYAKQHTEKSGYYVEKHLKGAFWGSMIGAASGIMIGYSIGYLTPSYKNVNISNLNENQKRNEIENFLENNF